MGGVRGDFGGLERLMRGINRLSGVDRRVTAVAPGPIGAQAASTFDAQEDPHGSAWGTPYKLFRKGDLRASVTTFKAVGTRLIMNMVRHGRFHRPPRFWPSRLPVTWRAIIRRLTRAELEKTMGAADMAQLFALEMLVRGVDARLKSHHSLGALSVLHGKPRADHTTLSANRVIFRERAESDDWTPNASAAGGNPQPAVLRREGAEVTIEGVSRAAGARDVDHRRVVKTLLHAVVEAMCWVARREKIGIELTGGGFVDDEDDSVEFGARYRLPFLLDEQISHASRSVADSPTYSQSGVIVIDGVEIPAC